ncbi:RHS repeat-associated core domain-containing protein, partial [Alistipes putredinis]|uniref:RHS repeat-associated core domain-containing protein n=1 Tax=Alistipes putredinis TaxID=28117 RepID=UPI0024B101EF
ARFYHPDLGRWLTQDPMATEYINISPYAYCVNNPIRYIDPDDKRIIRFVEVDGKSVMFEWKKVDNQWGFL